MRAVWRQHYNLPPNDPRFLALTDEELHWDLLLIAVAAADKDRAANQERRQVEDVALDQKATAALVQRAQDFSSAKATQQALRAVLGVKPDAPKVSQIRLSMERGPHGSG